MSEHINYLCFEIPLAIISEANTSRARPFLNRERRRQQQMEVMVELRNRLKGRKIDLPCRVTLTRIGPKRLDSDNIANACKGVQDQVAKEIGVDDGDVRNVTWIYDQVVTGMKEVDKRYGLRIKIESVKTP